MGVQIFYPGDDTDGWDLGQPAWFVAALPVRRRPMASADRTRSARWRVGSRRHRRLSRKICPVVAPLPLGPGWADLGWIDETGEED